MQDMLHEVCRISSPLLIESGHPLCPLEKKFCSPKNYEKSFDDCSGLGLRLKAEHLIVRSHVCFECGKSFATSSGLKQHQHIHRSIKPFQCEVCLKAYTQFSNLCRHKRMHADCRQLIKCGECGLSFSTTTSLSKHKRFCEKSKSTSQRNYFLRPENVMFSVPNYLFSKHPIIPHSEPHFELCSTFAHPLSRFFVNLIQPDAARSKCAQMESFYKAITQQDPERYPVIRKKHLIEDILKDSPSKLAKREEITADRDSEQSDVVDVKKFTKNKLCSEKDERFSSLKASHLLIGGQIQLGENSIKENLKFGSSFEPLDLSRNRLRSFLGLKSDDTTRSTNGSSSDSCLSNKIVHYSSLLYNGTVPDSRYLNIYQAELFCEASNRIPGKHSNQTDEIHACKVTRSSRTYKFHSSSDQSMHPINRQPISKVHLNSLKSKDRYSCRYCGKNFPRSANLTRHLRTHTGEQPYRCKYCERSFSISSNLQRHVRNIHNKEKPFKCPLCEKCFGQQTNLDRHLKKHDPNSSRSLESYHMSHDGRYDWLDHDHENAP